MTNGIIDIIKDNKIKVLIIFIIIVLAIVISILSSNMEKEVENKEFKNSDYIFTKFEKYKDIRCPYINVKSKTISNINGRIMEQYYRLINEDNKMDYIYSINDNILSLLIITTTKEIG